MKNKLSDLNNYLFEQFEDYNNLDKSKYKIVIKPKEWK